MNKLINKNKISGGVKFLIIVLTIYLVIALFNFSIVKDALSGFLIMFIKIIPILIIVFIIMVLVNLYFTKERIGQYLGVESGIMGWIYAMISGILFSGPPYVFFPLLGELKKRGMKNSLVAVFLYNRNVKIPFLPIMIHYFGFNFTIILSLYIIIFSILNGKIIGWLIKDKF
jgi:uncharacterized membrane protein YraQ (UPF0718 family)